MSPSLSVLDRAKRKLRRLFSGRGYRHGSIVDGVYDEAIQGVSADGAVTDLPTLITPLAASYPALWALPRLIARWAGERAKLRAALAAGYLRYVDAVVALRRMVATAEHAALEAEYLRLAADVHSATEHERSHRLPRMLYWLVSLIALVVDSVFLYSILTDVYQLSPSASDYWIKLVSICAISVITSIFVIVLSDWGGRRLARTRAEVRRLLDDEPTFGATRARRAGNLISLFQVPAFIMVLLVTLTVVFAQFGYHRFSDLTSQPGAIPFPPELLTFLIACLPLLTLIVGTLSHDVRAAHRETIVKRWTARQSAVQKAQNEVSAALSGWEGAWSALSARVGALVAEGRISVQTVEHLVLRGLALANQEGHTSYRLEHVTAVADPGALRPLEVLLSDVETEGIPALSLPVRQLGTSMSSAEWVLDELEIDLQWLVHYRPAPAGRAADEVERLLTLAARPAAPQEPAPGRDEFAFDPSDRPAVPAHELEQLFVRSGRGD